MKPKKLTRRQLEKELQICEKATKLEKLLRDPKSSNTLIYALQSILVELSNEVQVGIDHPSLAGTFYRLAQEKGAPGRYHSAYVYAACLRHLDVLLSQPTAKNARALRKFWDCRDLRKRVDPFPEK